jgi:hypothetical protein
MTNYKQFYNAWHSFAKPKRELLVEEEQLNPQMANVNSQQFLRLTVPPADIERIIIKPTEEEQKQILASKEEKFDIQRRALRMMSALSSIVKTEPPELILEPRGLDKQRDNTPVYQVVEHHGRARNLANIYNIGDTSGASLATKITFKDGKSLAELLASTTGALIQGQNAPGAYNVKIGIKDLITSKTPGSFSNLDKGTGTDVDKKQKYHDKLEEAKKKLAGGLVFKQKYYPSIDPTKPPVRYTFTADSQIGSILSEVFSAYKNMNNTLKLDELRNNFTKEMNNHFDVKNDKGQEFVIVNYKSAGGMFFFGVRKPGNENVATETEEQLKEKDTIIFKAK